MVDRKDDSMIITNKNEYSYKEHESFMEGCYYVHGDIEDNKYYWSKNAIDKFSIDGPSNQNFWQTFIHPDDSMLFAMLFLKQRKQISGDFRFKTKDGSYQWMQCTMQLEELHDFTRYSAVITEPSLRYSTKSVTRLRGNNGFRAVLGDITRENREHGVLMIGIDNFKNINELYSYIVGDEIIRTLAKRIQEIIPSDASLYQLDGDIFGVLYPNASLDDMQECFRSIQKITKPLMHYENMGISFTISGGICMYPYDGNHGEILYRNVRVAYNEAKNRGKNQFVIYNEEISSRTLYLAKLVESLRDSVNHNFKGFYLVYQPIVKADDEQVFGCEVLLRWKHKNFPEELSPTEFIPVLEKTGLIMEVGKWVLDNAFKQRKKWHTLTPKLQMSVNVTAEQFIEPSFISFVMDKLQEHDVDPRVITLELTESGEITDADQINKAFDFFRSQGMKIALDDFGTGYDSFSCFRLLSTDVLKIDRSFLERITYNITDQKIVHNIIALCKSMNMDVCIEGVETAPVRQLIEELGAKLIQGYYYSRPIVAEEFARSFLDDTSTPDTVIFSEQEEGLVYSKIKPSQAMAMDELVDFAHAGIFQVGMDEEFSFITCNEGYRRMLGYSATEIEEKFSNKALGCVHPDDIEYVNLEIRKQLGYGDTCISEFRVVRKDGSPIWVVGTGNVVKNRQGMPSLVVVIINIDDKKKQILKQEHAYNQYHRILKNIPAGVKCVRFDENFTIDYISPSFLSILGYDKSDIANIFDGKYINMIHEEDVVKMMNDIIEQLKTSNVVTLKYRSKCKDGSLMWVETISKLCPPDEDGIQRCYSSVISIDDNYISKRDQTTSSFKTRFQEASERWGDVLFELNVNSNYLHFSENFENLFGRKCIQYIEDELQYVHPEDCQLLKEAVEQAKNGVALKELEIRMIDSSGKYVWCSVLFNEPDKIANRPVLLLGKLNIIDKEKREREALIEKSELDSLTGILNKGTLETKIRTLLKEANKEQYALFMLDLDDFKVINDTCGHLFGDKLLIEIATRIQSVFTAKAIIGRAGGDEFIICIPYTGNKADLQQKGKELLNIVSKPFTYDNKEYRTAISIGISCFPKDGKDFYDLFKRADSALYRVKLQSKNDFCIF